MLNKNIRLTLIFTTVFLPTIISAANLEQIQQEGEKKLVAAELSQQKIDQMVAATNKRLIKYRALLKQIAGLEAYNEQLAVQVANQEDLLKRLDDAISKAALIERQMLPLARKMTDSLAQFVILDLPFHLVERQERMAFIADNLLAADIDISEKFRQVMAAYQIENEYGRKIDSYHDIVTLNGSLQEVDVLRVGRIAMVCQTKDTQISARWDNSRQRWEILDNITYRNPIRYGIKMAKKQASIDILTLPIQAPEAAQ